MKLAENSFSKLRVLVIGDCMLDQYMRGNTGRISPEADIPILENVSLKSELGGAANVANNIVLLGAKATLLSVIGDDKEGGTIKYKLREHHIHHELVVDRDRCTTVKTRLYDENKPIIRVDREEKSAISSRVNKNLLSKFRYLLNDRKYDIIILQDYNKGVLHEDNISSIIHEAKERDIFIAVDPKVDNFDLYKNVDLFKPNLKELSLQYNLLEPNSIGLGEIERLTKDKAKQIACTTFLVTLSDRGAMIVAQGESLYQDAIQIEVVDVCGAGDAVIAISALASAKGIENDRILELCLKTGEIVCKKTGVSGITVRELNN